MYALNAAVDSDAQLQHIHTLASSMLCHRQHVCNERRRRVGRQKTKKDLVESTLLFCTKAGWQILSGQGASHGVRTSTSVHVNEDM